ncbi:MULTISPECIES: hypothetical protein [Bradyrhizobium]|uniref:hypothetical protein n=1 Tax=Bradyrhizobium pachyrhizi TaxID=280333 RepID=UPI0018F8BD3D|nr:hypothetical protein [Bradyrhizobium pachyrhizi]
MRWVKSSSSLDPALNKALIFAAITETVTGLALVIVPSLVGHLLFGEDLSGIAIPIGRLTGIALIALGIACWPGPPLIGMSSARHRWQRHRYCYFVNLGLVDVGGVGAAG